MSQEFRGAVQQVAGRDIHNYAYNSGYRTLRDLSTDELHQRRESAVESWKQCRRARWWNLPSALLLTATSYLSWVALAQLVGVPGWWYVRNVPASEFLQWMAPGAVVFFVATWWLQKLRSRLSSWEREDMRLLEAIDEILLTRV